MVALVEPSPTCHPADRAKEGRSSRGETAREGSVGMEFSPKVLEAPHSRPIPRCVTPQAGKFCLAIPPPRARGIFSYPEVPSRVIRREIKRARDLRPGICLLPRDRLTNLSRPPQGLIQSRRPHQQGNTHHG